MQRFAVVVLIAFFAQSLSGQAALGTFSYSTNYVDPGQYDGYVAILDLQSSAFVPVVTGPTTKCPPPNTTYTTKSADFAHANQTFVTITANTGPGVSTTTSVCGTPDGLLVSNGYLVNWPQLNGPVLYFTSNSSATITDGALPWPSMIQQAVAGTTTQGNDCATCQVGGRTLQQAGTLLVKTGAAGACVIPKATTEIAARGAIGLDSTGRYLIILVVSGDDKTYGLYTPEFAELMLAFGGYNAVNFDGGGSTVFQWIPDFGSPAPCSQCASMITGAKLTNPTRGLTLSSIATPPMSTTTIQYTSQAGGRPVYASIGFRIAP